METKEYMRNTLVRDKLISLVLIAVLAMTFTCSIGNIPSYAASNVIIGHAATGENGSKNQQPGDQTGKEVYTKAWFYNSSKTASAHWTVVARCKEKAKAKRIAQVVKDACDNNNIGYCTTHYSSFYKKLKKTGDPNDPSTWDASKITAKTETTCTPLIASAVQAAGISLGDKVGYEADYLARVLASTGEFTLYFASEDSLYKQALAIAKNANDLVINSEIPTTDKYLITGDILLSLHPHGATVISSPNSATMKVTEKKYATSSNKSKYGYVRGKNYITKTDINVRYGPGTTYKKKKLTELTSDGQQHAKADKDGYAVLKSGTEVSVLEINGRWVRIPSGWLCGGTTSGTKYLKAVKTTKKTSKVTIKVGKDYKLLAELYVRTGPGTNYKAVKRSSLSASAKKYAVTGITAAKFKKGTVVTCLKKSGDWMKVPSGWICCKQGNVANA